MVPRVVYCVRSVVIPWHVYHGTVSGVLCEVCRDTMGGVSWYREWCIV